MITKLGLLDSPFSWLYYNIPINILRVYGQLILSRLVELCWMNNITVISVNTDGAELYFERENLDLVKKLIQQVMDEFKVEFESEEYTTIYYKNVSY